MKTNVELEYDDDDINDEYSLQNNKNNNNTINNDINVNTNNIEYNNSTNFIESKFDYIYGEDGKDEDDGDNDDGDINVQTRFEDNINDNSDSNGYTNDFMIYMFQFFLENGISQRNILNNPIY